MHACTCGGCGIRAGITCATCGCGMCAALAWGACAASAGVDAICAWVACAACSWVTEVWTRHAAWTRGPCADCAWGAGLYGCFCGRDSSGLSSIEPSFGCFRFRPSESLGEYPTTSSCVRCQVPFVPLACDPDDIAGTIAED
eukprot:scaffold273796_cov31-Tisochrysis_lutea.AAC.3